ncbi:ABC transporter ATP-binding protein [Microbacterium sorbitolivorans]|uniref:ABC transporter ATP-binding protein n=1 Tax=Microbacterium sorbitolivorans TaxID=1867410 RepID=A0A367Y5C8_9MICO|nr:ABC transporter ATP-binding protein [Microbacterium sorbitolivorans]RCK60221.1 ABC transporter ATP-binding protein [Microbacterium sorbitolivorans]GGF48932.1 ABC transporter ATP-binding protein [Microbacterium sorbitolivorans]
MSDTRRRSPFSRPRKDDGPRATFRQLLPYLLEHRGVMIGVAVLSVVAAVFTLVQPLMIGQVIARVESQDPLGWLIVLLVVFVLLQSATSAYQHYLLQRAGTAVVLSSRRRLIRRILHLPISEFDARRTGDLVSRVGTDTTLLYAVLTQGLADSVGNLLIFVGALIAMLVIDPILLLTIAVVLVAAVGAVTAFAGRIRSATAVQQTRVGELASGIERAIGSIRTIRASGATAREEEAVADNAQAAYRAGLDVAKASAFVVPVAGLAMNVSLLVVLGVGGLRVATGAVSVASLVTFAMFLFLMIMPLGSAFGALSSVGQALGALGRIQEVLDLPEEDANDTVRTGSAVPVLGSGEPAIAFEDVRFRYPQNVVEARREAAAEVQSSADDAHLASDLASASDGDVLRGVSFAVPVGSRIALVGPSGAGKSTILALIERFYDATGGSILLHGNDVRDLPREALRAQFGYVEQDAPTLAGSLADNLRLASPNATDADCERALRAVNLGHVIDRDQRGVDTPVGEDGVMLSGGERQRLAIARALLSAPPILLLDESTSSLDGLNEQRMREAIDAVAQGRTLIVIAHRLSTVIDSDKIVVLESGRVVGEGTHAELVESTPLYRELAEHQLLV